MSQRLATTWRKARPLFGKGGLVLLCGVALFEAGMRLLPPDAMRYEIQVSVNGGPPATASGTVTDPATIASWRAAVTATPSGRSLISTLVSSWRRQDECSPLAYWTVSYDFYWHGLPTESVSTLPVCGEDYMVSSGGIPDPRTYLVPLLVPTP